MKCFLLTLCSLVGPAAHADLVDIGTRPLRVLDIESEIITLPSLTKNAIYQNGKVVVIGQPGFESAQPYCEVQDTSVLSGSVFTLKNIDGFAADSGAGDKWTKFITKLHFVAEPVKTQSVAAVTAQTPTSVTPAESQIENPASKAIGELNIQCFSESQNAFREMTLNEFEKTFAGTLRLGRVSLGDSFVDGESVTPATLRKSADLKLLQPVSLLKNETRRMLLSTLIDGKVVTDNDLMSPYCELAFTPESDGDVLADSASLPAELKLSFGSITGFYSKSENIDQGFTFTSKLSGFDNPLQISCSATDPNKIPSYLGVQALSKSFLEWQPPTQIQQ